MGPVIVCILLAVLTVGVYGFTVAPTSKGHATRHVQSVLLFAQEEYSETTPEVSDIFTKELAEDLAKEVTKTVSLPFVPDPVVTFMLTEAIGQLSSDLSPQMLDKVREFLASSSTTSKYDDFSEEDRVALALQVAEEVNPQIDVPILDEEQELQVLQEIFKVVFACLSVNKSALRKQMIDKAPSVSRDLLGDESSRRDLAKAINEAVDIPLLDETQEEEVLILAVASCGDTLQTLLPPEFVETLKGERPEALLEIKQFLVQKVNEKVDLVGLNEEQEQVLIEKTVDILVDKYVDGTEVEFMLMGKEEQLTKLEEKKLLLEREIELSKQRFEREQENLAARMERINLKMKEARRGKVAQKGAAPKPAGKKRRLFGIFRRSNAD